VIDVRDDWRTATAAGHTRASDGELLIGGVRASNLASTYGTPAFVIDLDVVDRAIATFVAACAPHTIGIAYAGKAFLCTAFARHLAARGLDLDVCSLGELLTAERAGFPPERLAFHGCGKSDVELDAAAAGRVGVTIVDNREELERLARRADPASPLTIMLRINVGIEAHTHDFVRTTGENTKFGFPLDEVDAAFVRLRELPGLRCLGLHAHIGSQIAEADPYYANLRTLIETAARARTHGIDVERLIVGGGYGVEEAPGEGEPIDIEALFTGLAAGAARFATDLRIPTPRLAIEPGRAIVARAGTSLYSVMAVKRQGRRRFVVADGGIADNPRPALYGAYHHPLVARSAADAAVSEATICGRSCENDVLVTATLPDSLASGDLLVLCTTGAYTYAMASNYNRFGKPPVVFVGGGAHRLAVRGERPDDVLRNDLDA
jgi:diaminopimelate decarboxylase